MMQVYDMSDELSKISALDVEQSVEESSGGLVAGGEGVQAVESARKRDEASALIQMESETAEVRRTNTSKVANVVVNVNVGNLKRANVIVNVNGTVNGTVVVTTNVTMNASTALNASGKQPLPPPTPHGVFGWLRFSLSFAIIIKALCMMSNILFQASPLPAAKLFMEQGDTGDTDSAPFISIAYGSSQWCFYGLFAFIVTGKSGFLVLVYSNIVGAILGLYYVYSFNKNCSNKVMMEK